MQGIKNLYSELNCIITDRELRDQASIKIEDIVSEVRKRVNVHSASRKWLEYRVLMASAENVLWRRGYRSLVKSKGWFVHLENCSKPEFLKRLFNNAKLSEAQKEAVVNRIKKQIKTTGCDGQLSFDMNGYISEDLTDDQLIELIEREARLAESVEEGEDDA